MQTEMIVPGLMIGPSTEIEERINSEQSYLMDHIDPGEWKPSSRVHAPPNDIVNVTRQTYSERAGHPLLAESSVFPSCSCRVADSGKFLPKLYESLITPNAQRPS